MKLDADEKELLSFIAMHNEGEHIILNCDKVNEIVKYFYAFRVRKYTELCKFLNEQSEIFKQNFLKLDYSRCMLAEKNYSIQKKEEVLFKPEHLALAFTLTPKVNTDWMYRNING